MTQPKERIDYVSAAEATETLGIRAQTLYAYVSRGWVRSLVQAGRKNKLYSRDDIVRLKKRSEARAGHGAVAAAAMNWGEPIFMTAITEITLQGPCYRGRLASDLANAGLSFEAVTEWLWTGQMPLDAPLWPVNRLSDEMSDIARTLGTFDPCNNTLEVFAMVVLMLGLGQDSTSEAMAKGNTLTVARAILQAIVACCGFIGPAHRYRPMQRGESVVKGIMQSLNIEESAENSEALRVLFILLADHELTPGVMGARVVASAGGSLQACLSSAFCATSGSEVGRMYQKIQQFLDGSRTLAPLLRRARTMQALGQEIPGFRHPLYPMGDPRAAKLLEMTRRRSHLTQELKAIFDFLDKMSADAGLYPRQEFALVVLTRAMGLPSQAAAALFSVGRFAGWVAHVLEQRADGSLLRPRARFSPGN